MSLVLSKSRAVVTSQYALLPPEGIPESTLPEFTNTKAFIQISPDIGNARFGQIQLRMKSGAMTRSAIHANLEHFFYVLSGSLDFRIGEMENRLAPGGYAYVPPGSTFELFNAAPETQIEWVKRRYEKINLPEPKPILSDRNDRPEIPDEVIPGCFAQFLLDENDLANDMSMKIIILEPGAYFDCVETHVMEHGLYMLSGKGIYYLAGTQYEVQESDFIWMAPYCPQFYYCTGLERSSYLLYKNINRDIRV